MFSDPKRTILYWLIAFLLATFFVPQQYTIAVKTTISDHHGLQAIEYLCIFISFCIYAIYVYKYKSEHDSGYIKLAIFLMIIVSNLIIWFLYLFVFVPKDFDTWIFLTHDLYSIVPTYLIAFLASGDLHIPPASHS